MSHNVYIIYSKSIDRFYVGETVDVAGRVGQHNSGFYKYASTKAVHDWELYFEIECADRNQALKLEKFIKQMKSRKFYVKLKEVPGLVQDLKDRFAS
jgi:putative endonuclease